MIATVFLSAAFAVSSMQVPEYADCEVLTNCTFDVSSSQRRIFTLQMTLDVSPSNGVEVVFGRDTDGDGILSRSEEGMIVGCDCGEWKVVDCASGAETVCAGTPGRSSLDWKVRLDRAGKPRALSVTVNGQPAFPQLTPPPSFLFDTKWNVAKVVQRGRIPANPRVVSSVDVDPVILFVR